MPNYSLVSNSVFQPFTYQELAAPLDRQEAYQESLEQQYEQLSDKADILEAMGKNDRDKKVYGQYKAYSDALRTEADNLYRYGLNSESRMRLTDLRRRYNQEIVPIQNAWNKREQEAQMQLQASMNNPMLRFTRDARDTGLDYYIDNPMGGFGAVNLTTVSAMMSNMAKNLAKQIRAGNNEGIDEYTFKHISKHGLDPNLINQWINNPDSNPTLTNMLNQVLAANGLTAEMLQNNPKGAALIGEATKAAQMGAWDAVGEDKEHILENFGKRKALEHSYAVDMENRKFAHDLAVKQAPSYSDLKAESGALGDGSYSPIYTTFDYELPMTPANFNGSKDREEALRTLGFTDDGNGNLKHTGKVTLSYRMSSKEREEKEKKLRADYDALAAKIKKGTATEQEKNRAISYAQQIGRYGNLAGGRFQKTSSEASLYDSNGRIMTRKQFVAQAGDSPYAKKAYEDYFDKMVKAGKTLGVYGTLYTPKQVAQKYNALRTNSAASMVRAIPLEYEKDAWNPTSTIMKLREITGYKEGKPIYSEGRTSLGDILKKKNKDGTDIDISPFWVDEEGKQGLVIATHEDGRDHRYYISSIEMPVSAIQEAVNNFTASNKAFNLGDVALGSSERERALGALNSGLTLVNKRQTQEYGRQLTLKQLGLTE